MYRDACAARPAQNEKTRPLAAGFSHLVEPIGIEPTTS
jgi:hypothetical protein